MVHQASHFSGDTPSKLGVSVIIPTLNEVGNVEELLMRLSAALRYRTHEFIFIDDHSTDGTVEKLVELSRQYGLVCYLKRGKAGKAYSILEGVTYARHPLIAMIDADLQYPPEAIPGMMSAIESGQADIVVGNRRPEKTNKIRKAMSVTYRWMVCKAMWKLNVDIQSGLKVMRREVITRATLNPKSPWALDLELLLNARCAGYSIGNHDITFTERKAGDTKVRWFSTSRQLGMSALSLRLKPPHYVAFDETMLNSQGQGFHYNGEKYVTHTSLSRDEMAITRTSPLQAFILCGILSVLILALVINWHATLVALVTFITVWYFIALLFNLYLISRSYSKDIEIRVSPQEIAARDDWPMYTIFCPLYKESAVVPQFIKAMSELDYPKDKLEVQLLLEEDDVETVEDIRNMTLPSYFTILVVPHAMPKTKPKACNYGLQRASGEYAVIYDAEDIPEPMQLKKAVIAFDRAGHRAGCIQAKLNYYNWNQNLLTRLFTLEYSLWFNLVLTGLQAVKAPVPLGGTSNHFRVADLRRFAGWDPFNVTEDADLGMRIAKQGMHTEILDSYTLEEANSQYGNWLKQRSRWIKGYMQTYLLHMRRPRSFAKNKSHLFMIQLVLGGTALLLLVNPLVWLLTIAYFVMPGNVSNFIASLYSLPVLYMGVICLVFGNFIYMYYYMMGASKQKRPELIAYAFFMPMYWLMMSWAALLALRDLIVRPHHWHKTKHGLHLQNKQPDESDLRPRAAA